MTDLKNVFLLCAIMVLAGCSPARDFGYGLKEIDAINIKYNVTMSSSPVGMQRIDSMIADLDKIKGLELGAGKEPFIYLIEIRLLNLKAEKLYIESQKYGASGTTKNGFGCKIRPLIIESASLRNQSALKGFEAAGLLEEFVGKHPEDAALAGFSFKSVLFLNATFYEIYREAGADSSTINKFCPANVTLDIYKQNFRKRGFIERNNLSEDYINGLGYDEAVRIWKKDVGIE